MTAERPRDRLGRPLRQGAAPDPDVPPVPDVQGLSDDEVLTLALRFVEDGLPFHAHEVCEQRWRAAPPPDREHWRALAQWGAAETHAARGNTVGATRLATRALDGLKSGSESDEAHVDGPCQVRVRERCQSLI